MKKTITIFISFIFGSLLVSGQTTSVGVFGGMNLSNVNGRYNSNGYNTKTTSLITKQFGIVLSYPLSDKLSLFSDPGFYERGFNYEPVETMVGGATVKGRSKFKSVDVPLTLKIGMFKNQIFYFRAGAYLSFLLSANNNDTIYYSTPGVETQITENDILDKMNRTVFGFITGVGFDIPVSKNLGLLFDVAYRLDLTDAMINNKPSYWNGKSSDSYYIGVENVRNRSLTISIGLTYRFPSGQ